MTDRELQRQVEIALNREPGIEAHDIGVSVQNGVVTLRGDVHTSAQKSAAERVALRVHAVKAVANDINVRLTSRYERTDTEIAQAAVAALKRYTMVPAASVRVTVADGWITLNGTVDRDDQWNAVERAVRDLAGVTGVTNSIMLTLRVPTLPAAG